MTYDELMKQFIEQNLYGEFRPINNAKISYTENDVKRGYDLLKYFTNTNIQNIATI